MKNHLQEGSIKGVYKKPQNCTNNNRELQNQNKFWSKLKTSSKIRGDMHAVKVIEVYIFWRETGKLETASNSKSENLILFLPKVESEMENKLQTTTDTKTEAFCYKNRKTDIKNGQNCKTENPNGPSYRRYFCLCFLC